MSVKSKIKTSLTHLFSTNPSKLYYEATTYDVVSFDVFETLVFRDIENIEALYIALAQKLKVRDKKYFVQKRINTEMALRVSAPNSEPTLKEIYNSIYNDESYAVICAKKEEELHLALCCGNSHIVDILNRLSESNNIIICITSDTVLSEETVRKILSKCGVKKYDYIFVSSERRATKRNGNLFLQLKNKMSQQGVNSVLHVGNDFKADYLKPLQNGIKSFLINTETDYRFKQADLICKKVNNLNIFLANHKANGLDDYSKIGYEIVGPLLFSFSLWLHENSNSKLVFLSREGKILRDAYSRIFPDESIDSVYLHVSRKAILACVLYSCENMEELLNRLTPISSTRITINDLLDLNYIDEKDAETFRERLGINQASNINLIDQMSNQELCSAFNKYLLPSIKDRSYEQANAFFKYFESIVGDAPKINIVDIGWRGSMQDAICDAVGCLKQIDIEGFYFGVYGDVRTGVDNFEVKHGMLFEDNDRRSELFYQLTLTVQFFEMLFLGEEGTTSHYQILDGCSVPVLEANELSQFSKNSSILVRQGAFDFIEDYLAADMFCSSSLGFQSIDAFDNYLSIATRPSLKMIEAFGSFGTKNINTEPIFGTKTLKDVFVHPKSFVNELKNSYCKLFYLKRVFKLPLPYYELLKRLKKKEEKKRLDISRMSH